MLGRDRILSESNLPGSDALLAAGRRSLAGHSRVAGCTFFIAISTYNGDALDFVHRLMREPAELGMKGPVFIGDKLNQVPQAGNSSLPAEVSAELKAAGAPPWHGISVFRSSLATLVRETSGAATV